MTTERKLELLKIERSCIRRNIEKKCDRNCGCCDLVQEDDELLELYDELVDEYYKKVWTEKFEAIEQEIVYNRINGCC